MSAQDELDKQVERAIDNLENSPEFDWILGHIQEIAADEVYNEFLSFSKNPRNPDYYVTVDERVKNTLKMIVTTVLKK
jgi:hypothetical protein